ncbi:hypothetical protein FOL46_005186 [Perkinsus olseni]|uniref:Uncharacterized protein n=1 Tax=Perkinsus olseni TaxID=32597 RepID=A0A7J6LTQ2_PEROL|nr:hypothetical protein FOL46_005186 [Perkinsus olseni]
MLSVLQTVIGYRKTPGVEKFEVTDVTHLEFNPAWEKPGYKYVILADEDVLIKNFVNVMRGPRKNITTQTPPSLKRQLMYRFGRDIWGEFNENNHRSAGMLVCGLYTLFRERQRGRPKRTIRYSIFLTRLKPHEAFRFTALRVALYVHNDTNWWMGTVKPKFNADRLEELLSRSEIAKPDGVDVVRDSKIKTCTKQILAYSNFISPPGSNIPVDTWPAAYEEAESSSEQYPPHIINIFHWLTNGTTKY